MKGPEHYRAAEQAVEESRLCTTAGGSRMWLQKAAIHAQLAYTAALVGLMDEDTDHAWRDVLGQAPASDSPADRPVREVLAEMHGGQPVERATRLIPEDTCGSWIGGRRCILRPGHDEPCLPYRIPAGDVPRCPAVSTATGGRCWHARGHDGEHATSSAAGSIGWVDAPGTVDADVAPAGPASRDDGDLGPVIP